MKEMFVQMVFNQKKEKGQEEEEPGQRNNLDSGR